MVPATMRDLHRGSTFAGTTDGLARVIPLRRLSDAELRRLSSLVGGDATAEVLHPGSHHLVDPNDFRVRVAMERDALALAQVYGVDELALRAMNTTSAARLELVPTTAESIPVKNILRSSARR
ncbi:hypothetical protein PF011_g27949 [Phytophthora fragariae]|uniref:Uncharacterized protein n=1 Tax=Phytophthora fragariae TaxID=53985 RepID=A0A6A3HB92_9STRA|nr:hypothetical protein PF011_g27949 [Phytophthora fragariae]